MAADCEPSLDHHVDMDDVQLNGTNSVLNENDKEHSDNDMSNGEGKEDNGCYKRYSELTSEDIWGMEFKTEEEACEFYEMYAKDLGFTIRKDELRCDDHKNVIMRQLVCNKEGKTKKKRKLNEDKSTHHRPYIRDGCKARIRFVFDFAAKIWTITAFEPSHNHDLVPSGFVHLIPKYSELSQADKEVVGALHSQGVRTYHVSYLRGQKGGHKGVQFIKKDLYDFTPHQGRDKVQDVDTYATLSYLQRKADNDNMFYYRFTLSDDGQIENLFWADSTSQLDFDCFGDVVAFDTTYKKNMYNKHLIIFCGYNHHGETTIFACALISSETLETYKWVLNMFSEAMSKHPHAVVSDGDKAMGEAIRVVFPNTLHRLCSWHIHQNACENVKNPKFLSDFKSLMYSYHTPEKFEAEWKRVIDMYGISENTWIKKVYQSRTMWASSYMQDKFFCGIRTTSICEGVNSFIKKYVQQKSSLVDFLYNFERAVKEYRHNELTADFQSLYHYERTLTTALRGIELEASRIFTNKIFIEVKKAIKGVAVFKVIERNTVGNTVTLRISVYYNNDHEFLVSLNKVENKFLCDCRRFERKGLMCSHIICLMMYEDMDRFPDSLICKRWTKMAKKDCITSIGSREGGDEKMVMFRRSALLQAFEALRKVCCEDAIDYKEALEGIYSLHDKISKRRVDAKGNDKHKVVY